MTSDTPPARPAAADCRPPALAGDLRVSVTHLVRRLRLERVPAFRGKLRALEQFSVEDQLERRGAIGAR